MTIAMISIILIVDAILLCVIYMLLKAIKTLRLKAEELRTIYLKLRSDHKKLLDHYFSEGEIYNDKLGIFFDKPENL